MELQRGTLAKLLAVVFVFNLVVMGAGALYSYEHTPPIPKEVAGPGGETVVTGAQVREGKTVVLQQRHHPAAVLGTAPG